MDKVAGARVDYCVATNSVVEERMLFVMTSGLVGVALLAEIKVAALVAVVVRLFVKNKAVTMVADSGHS